MTVTVVPDPADPVPLAEQVAAVVTAHPAVAGLHGGIYGAVATYLPGRRLTGVRIGEGDEPVEVAVVLRLGHPIPGVVSALRREVSAMCGGAAVDITVADIAVPADLEPAAGAPAGGSR
ncbi:MAG: hypothetical protein QOG20_4101 [Pseudonocardiales bacterium]|uniref:hypothetical protein n=1 Tax=Pseudonocardia sp. TaxID=60912 RepID=UPI00260B2080|nr:hypothetical protein [Pseudonocardia sp.]MCW2718676.1 hypothetical protein [Pseudonocardia sp.]MDT7617500.1 hypothetical protein [Pseudonocardiales bacterium]MDT7708494.1 hypothetical protein [Pseudonocardiales bacterium]